MRDGLADDLRGAGVVLKSKQRVVRTGARTPQPKALLTHQRRHLFAVEVIGIGGGAGDVKVHVDGEAGDAVDADVGDGFVPAHVLVKFGAQAEGDGDSVDGGRFLGRLVEAGEVRPHQHQFARMEVIAVGDDLFFGIAHGTGIDKAA